MGPLEMLDSVMKNRLRSLLRSMFVFCETSPHTEPASDRCVKVSVAKLSSRNGVQPEPSKPVLTIPLPLAAIATSQEPPSCLSRLYRRLVTAPVLRSTLRRNPCTPLRWFSATYKALPSGVISTPFKELP